MGANDVLSKPLYLEELNSLVRKYSSHRASVASIPTPHLNPTAPHTKKLGPVKHSYEHVQLDEVVCREDGTEEVI